MVREPERPGGNETERDSHPEGALSERLDRLNRSLGERDERDRLASRKAGSGGGQGYAQAMKLSSEFIAGILVGAGLGWLIDRGLGTSPWGLIVFLMLGFVAGVLNLLRSAGMVADPGARKPDGPRDDRPRDDGPRGG